MSMANSPPRPGNKSGTAPYTEATLGATANAVASPPPSSSPVKGEEGLDAQGRGRRGMTLRFLASLGMTERGGLGMTECWTSKDGVGWARGG